MKKKKRTLEQYGFGGTDGDGTLEDNDKISSEWLINWYTQRAKLPQFKKDSDNLISQLPKVRLNPNKDKLKRLTGSGTQGRGDVYITETGNNPETFIHEKTHAIDELGFDYDYGKNLIEKNRNSNLTIDSDPNLIATTETYARLNEFRYRNNIDPKKKYTLTEATKFIKDSDNLEKASKNNDWKATYNDNVDKIIQKLDKKEIDAEEFYKLQDEERSKYHKEWKKNKIYDWQNDEFLRKQLGNDPKKLLNLLNGLAKTKDNTFSNTAAMGGVIKTNIMKKPKKYAFGSEDLTRGRKGRRRDYDCPEGDCGDGGIKLPDFLLPNIEKREARANNKYYNSDEWLLDEINYPGVGTNRYYPVHSFDPQPDKDIPRFPSNRLTGVNYDPNNMMAMGGFAKSLLTQAPSMLDTIMGLFENNEYSRQPIVNSSTTRNMSNPYSNSMAMGGTIDDLDEDEYATLEEKAEEAGVSPEEMFEQLQNEEDIEAIPDGDEGEEEYEDMEYEDEEIPDEEDENILFAYGGRANKVKVNVEGGEAIQTPTGKIKVIKGPKHEKGGVNVKVPNKSKVYSDRLELDEKSMKQRKLLREARLSKLAKLLDGNPDNVPIKNTANRTAETIQREEAQDMALQKAASKIYASPQEQEAEEGEGYAYGGKVKKYGYGDIVDPEVERMARQFELENGVVPYSPVFNPNPMGDDHTNPLTFPNSHMNRSLTPLPDPATLGAKDYDKAGGLTTGDYIGMIGTGFNAIAPIINSNQAARATKPTINRYRGFGHEAIEGNDKAQGYVAAMKANAETNLSTSKNSRYMRNNNSASSINVLRALDAATDVAADKSSNAIDDTFAKQQIGLMSERGRLTNQRDQYEAYGQTQADIEDEAKMDNMYTNRGANLINFGRGVQTIGRNLNISKRNRVDANLLSQFFSKYGLDIDDDGNPVNKKK